jgi:hypothetical protein
MNGDGVNDLVIAAPSASPTGSTTENGKLNSGQTYVIFGRPGNFPAILNIADLLGGNGSIGFAINGMRVKDQIGQAIGSAGDINGDGTADIVIGAHAVNLDSNAGGQSYIVLGRTSGPFPAILELTDVQSGDGSTGIIIDGTTGSSGFSVAGLGDFNSDGLDDVAIGAPYHNSEGAVYVLLGRDKTRPLPAIISLAEFEDDINDYGFIIHGAERDQKSGSAIANAGDINNDLIPDLLIGAPDANTSSILKIKPGEVFAIYGGVDIAQREIRPEAHKGGVPNRTPDPDTRRPQTAVGHAWWLLLILFLAKTYPRWRSGRRD